ncbi:unnamed protein product [Allacma fusca]|uniref:AN1-type domain-containing protein n=1 Tax=Allacma fusca TaxID=39272 RepID=A0A8J2JNA6_9HEXA|nr:unnamed protein product [Allacma fusca]
MTSSGNNCREYGIPSTHKCEQKPDNIVEEPLPKERWQFKCSFGGCSNKELVPIKCTNCSQNYCLQHRHPDQHGCAKPDRTKPKEINPTIEKQTEIKNQISTKLEDVKAKGGAKGAMAAKLALMKLKGRAEGDKAIPQAERVYFIISVPNPEQNPKPLDMFVSKVWTTGKIVDVIARRARIKNRNNQADAPKLHLFKDDICFSDPFDRSINQLFQENILQDGDSISLRFV